MPQLTDTNADTVINLADRELTGLAELYRDHCKGKGRLQIGSYLCGNYFRHLCTVLTRSELPELYDLVLPVLAQHDLAFLDEERAQSLIDGAHTLVVNDPGMLMRFGCRKNVRLGRLFFRAYRDHRYPYYENSGAAEDMQRPLLSSLKAMGCTFSAVEREVIGNSLSPPAKGELPAEGEPPGEGELPAEGELPIYYHLPYRLISGIRICEYASAGKAVDRKFMPDDACSLQCLRFNVWYKDKEFGNEYVKLGRGLYDLAPECTSPGRYLIITPGLIVEER